MILRRTRDLSTVAQLDAAIIGAVLSAAELAASVWWLARDDDGDPVGYCGACIEPESPRVCYLIRAGVLPDARGQGLQRRMIAARLAWARGQGLTTAITYTTATNVRSMRSLARARFLPYAPADPWAGAGSVYWHRTL